MDVHVLHRINKYAPQVVLESVEMDRKLSGNNSTLELPRIRSQVIKTATATQYVAELLVQNSPKQHLGKLSWCM